MDAVVFMEAVKGPGEQPAAPPPPPSERKPQGLTANAALIAGIGTLVLAIGVGVLIGRSGDNGSATAANAQPQIIKVGGGSGGEEEESSTPESKESNGGGKKKSGGKKAGKKESAADEAGEAAAAEVLKPADGVDLPDSTTQVGEKCDKGEAGCSDSGEFDGSFFGE